MPKGLELIGQQFGRLEVIEQRPSAKGGRSWLCRCQCGAERVVLGCHLRSGHTTSCGCLKVDEPAHLIHGQARKGQFSKAYNSWAGMMTRCTNPDSNRFKDYGARGIQVCERWQTFENFYADMGDRPEGKTLDRIDVNGNYEPGNCRWATSVEQRHNRRDRAA